MEQGGGVGSGITLSEEHYSALRGFPTRLLEDAVYTYPSVSFRLTQLHLSPEHVFGTD